MQQSLCASCQNTQCPFQEWDIHLLDCDYWKRETSPPSIKQRSETIEDEVARRVREELLHLIQHRLVQNLKDMHLKVASIKLERQNGTDLSIGIKVEKQHIEKLEKMRLYYSHPHNERRKNHRNGGNGRNG